MVVVMAPDATAEDVARVVAQVEGAGGEAFVSRGVTRTIVGPGRRRRRVRRPEPAALPGVSRRRPGVDAVQAGRRASTTRT